MWRQRQITNASACYFYFEKSDSGLDAKELRKEVGGQGAKLLGVAAEPEFEQFKRLLNGLDPWTGEPLTAGLKKGFKPPKERTVGWEFTASVPKGVTVALESGDRRIQEIIWEAGRETMADLEKLVATRVHKGDKYFERVTGNLIYYAFEHPETRPSKQDNMPDPDRHIHFVMPNATYDAVAGQWQAIKMQQTFELRKWFDRRFDMRVANKLADLGYSIETKYKKGKYHSWDIKDIPESVTKKFSRRTQEVEKLATDLGVVSPMGKDKLGATSRLHKRKDLTLEDYRKYWDGRITPEERGVIQKAIISAMKSLKPKHENTIDKAADYALRHHFYRNSVVSITELEITAMERSMGTAIPEDVKPELVRQGLLEKDGEASTKEVLNQEGRIIDFAREGRGTMRPLMGSTTLSGPASPSGRLEKAATLSAEQQAAIRHVWNSPDQVMLIRGGAGTGKTTMMKTAIAGIDKPVAVLAPSASASRDTLRKEGFKDANTVAAFLRDEQWQKRMKNGALWVDEAALLPIVDLDQLIGVAKRLNARLVLQGDPKQHKSVARHGNMFHVLQKYAGLPLAELKDIKRQKGKYKEAVAAIDRGDILKGHDILESIGAIKHEERLDGIAEDYVALRNGGESVLVLSPTHAVGDALAGHIRSLLKQAGKLAHEERIFTSLRNLGWSDAQKGDMHNYDGTEIIQFFRNSGSFKTGAKYGVGDLLAAQKQRESRKRGPRSTKPAFVSKHFSVYSAEEIGLSSGDVIRITAGGKSLDGHQLDNGNTFTVAGFTDKGDIALTNGWMVSKDFGHISHAYTTTSFGAQGKTVDHVLIAMNQQTAPALNAEQFYVSASRGRKSATIYTDMEPADLRALIKRQDRRKSATEVFGTDRMKQLAKRARQNVVKMLYEQQQYVIPPEIPRLKIERSLGYER